MNKQKKRHISAGKFNRIKSRCVRGMYVNAFQSYDSVNKTGHTCFVTDGFFYWAEVQFTGGKARTEYFRKSLAEALS